MWWGFVGGALALIFYGEKGQKKRNNKRSKKRDKENRDKSKSTTKYENTFKSFPPENKNGFGTVN